MQGGMRTMSANERKVHSFFSLDHATGTQDMPSSWQLCVWMNHWTGAFILKLAAIPMPKPCQVLYTQAHTLMNLSSFHILLACSSEIDKLHTFVHWFVCVCVCVVQLPSLAYPALWVCSHATPIKPTASCCHLKSLCTLGISAVQTHSSQGHRALPLIVQCFFHSNNNKSIVHCLKKTK